MNFNKLDEKSKQQLHDEISQCANMLGGKNSFLTMIEEIREQKPNPILNKSGTFHTSKVKITLNKAIFKATLASLYDAIRREEKFGDMLNTVEQKDYKSTMNMMKTLKNTTITLYLKGEDTKSFTFPILDVSEDKKTKVTFLYKAIFFYNLAEAKKALSYNE